MVRRAQNGVLYSPERGLPTKNEGTNCQLENRRRMKCRDFRISFRTIGLLCVWSLSLSPGRISSFLHTLARPLLAGIARIDVHDVLDRDDDVLDSVLDLRFLRGEGSLEA